MKASSASDLVANWPETRKLPLYTGPQYHVKDIGSVAMLRILVITIFSTVEILSSEVAYFLLLLRNIQYVVQICDRLKY